MKAEDDGPVISLMLAVPDAPTAAGWYQHALAATEVWNLGSAIGLEVQGARFFVGQPANNGWHSAMTVGTTTIRVEVFLDDPDAFVERAIQAGANGGFDAMQDHQMPWGRHRQGGFTDPFGHLWLVADKSPLRHFPS